MLPENHLHPALPHPSIQDQATDRVWGKRQGAIDYLIKPIEENQLIDVIKQFLN